MLFSSRSFPKKGLTMNKGKFDKRSEPHRPKAEPKTVKYKVISPFSVRNKRIEPGTLLSEKELGISPDFLIKKGLIEKA